jgi:hypothetical protein
MTDNSWVRPKNPYWELEGSQYRQGWDEGADAVEKAMKEMIGDVLSRIKKEAIDDVTTRCDERAYGVGYAIGRIESELGIRFVLDEKKDDGVK